MPTLTPEKPSARLSEAEEILVRQELEARLASLDQEWREFKKLLKTGLQNSMLTEKLDSQVYMKNLKQVVNKEASISETKASPSLPGDKIDIAVSPLEAEAIIDRLRKSDGETKILERLARVERQTRRLSIYGSIFCLLMVPLMLLSMLFSLSLI